MLPIKYIFIIPAFALLFFSCKKEDEPNFSNTPQISLVSHGPSLAMAGVDSIWFVISYRDGDGDLGENNADVKNLFVTDTRLNLTYEMRVKQLVPGNAGVPITGELNFSIGTTVHTGTSAQENVVYTIQVSDRAGNKSNIITCPAIKVKQ